MSKARRKAIKKNKFLTASAYKSFSHEAATFLQKSKKNWAILFLAAIFTFASGIQATGWLFQQLTKSYNNNIGWKNEETSRLNSLAANMQLGAVKKALDSEPLLINAQGDFIEYTFRQRGGWVQVITDKNQRTLMYSIAICDLSFKPRITLSNGRIIKVNEDHLDTLNDLGEGKTLYFISGATANSYLLEGGYAANPGNYQSYYAGATDSCGVIDVPDYAYAALDENACKSTHLGLQGRDEEYCQYDKNNTKINQMRMEVKINTIIVTAPVFTIDDLGGAFNLGPNRLELRVLTDYNKSTGELIKTIPYYN